MASNRAMETVAMYVPKFGAVVTVNATDVEYWMEQGGVVGGAPVSPAEDAVTAATEAVVTADNPVTLAKTSEEVPVASETMPVKRAARVLRAEG